MIRALMALVVGLAAPVNAGPWEYWWMGQGSTLDGRTFNDLAGVAWRDVWFEDFTGDRIADFVDFTDHWSDLSPILLNQSLGDGRYKLRRDFHWQFSKWRNLGAPDILIGDFAGNSGKDFVLLQREADSTWESIPSAHFEPDKGWAVQNRAAPEFAAWARNSSYQPVVGRFDRHYGDDIALVPRHFDLSTMPVAFSQLNAPWIVTNRPVRDFAGDAALAGVEPFVGDFDGDGLDDIALLRRSGDITSPGIKHWDVLPIAYAEGNGWWSVKYHSAAEFSRWLRTDGVRPLIGDFDGDNSDDIALVRLKPGWGTVPVAYGNGRSGFTVVNAPAGNFAAKLRETGVTPFVGDTNSDRRDDIVLGRTEPGWDSIPELVALPGRRWQVFDHFAVGFIGLATQPSGRLNSGSQPYQLRVFAGEINGDRRLDLALLGAAPPPLKTPGIPMAISGDRVMRVRFVSVQRHDSLTVSDADIDTTLVEVGAMAHRKAAPGDVSCPVHFVRRGAVGTLSDVPVVATNFDTNRIFARRYDFTIMRDVVRCGLWDQGSNVAGCASKNKGSIVQNARDPFVWLHEFGHFSGLAVGKHHPDMDNLMYFQSIGQTGELTTDQCDAIRDGLPTQAERAFQP